ncbi:Beta sliding clamp [Desulfarculales bacterium]
MELTVRKDDLAKGLAKSQSVVERRTAMPILSNVLLDALGEQLTITGTDLETSFIGVYPARVSKPGRVTVPARKLYEIAKELPAEEVFLKEKDNNYLHITGGRAIYDLVGLSAADYPELPQVDGIPQLPIESEVLGEMIEKTIFSISQEDTRFNLAGLYVQKCKKDDGHRLCFVSTDGHRLSLIDKEVPGLEDFALKAGVIIPRKGVAEMRKLAETGGSLVLGLSQRFAVVKKDEVRLILRMQEGSFPDYEVVISKNTKRKVLVNRQAFEGVLKRVSLIATDRFQGVRLDFKEGLLEVISNNSDLGEAREALEVDYEGESFGVGFNARYFLDLCAAMRSEEISLNFVDEQNPCVIKGEGDVGFLSVIMPMRL